MADDRVGLGYTSATCAPIAAEGYLEAGEVFSASSFFCNS